MRLKVVFLFQSFLVITVVHPISNTHKIAEFVSSYSSLNCLTANPQFKSYINNSPIRTLDVVFSRFRGFSFTITQRQKHKVVTSMHAQFRVIPRGMRLRPQGYFEQKTSYSVLSIFLLINGQKLLLRKIMKIHSIVIYI